MTTVLTLSAYALIAAILVWGVLAVLTELSLVRQSIDATNAHLRADATERRQRLNLLLERRGEGRAMLAERLAVRQQKGSK